MTYVVTASGVRCTSRFHIWSRGSFRLHREQAGGLRSDPQYRTQATEGCLRRGIAERRARHRCGDPGAAVRGGRRLRGAAGRGRPLPEPASRRVSVTTLPSYSLGTGRFSASDVLSAVPLLPRNAGLALLHGYRRPSRMSTATSASTTRRALPTRSARSSSTDCSRGPPGLPRVRALPSVGTRRRRRRATAPQLPTRADSARFRRARNRRPPVGMSPRKD